VEHIVEVLLIPVEEGTLLVLEKLQNVVHFTVYHPPFVLQYSFNFGFAALLFLLHLGAIARVAAVSAEVGLAKVIVDALVKHPRSANYPLLALCGVRLIHEGLPLFSVLMDLLLLASVRVVDPLPHSIPAPLDGLNFCVEYDSLALDDPVAGHKGVSDRKQRIQ
jgi:quinol-cytochrome oxidoreductase complex cytochrome b subunit